MDQSVLDSSSNAILLVLHFIAIFTLIGLTNMCGVQNRKELPPHLLQDIKPVPLQHAQRAAASLQPPPLPTSSSVAWHGQSAPALPKSEPASAPTVVLQLANSAPSPSTGPASSLAQISQVSLPSRLWLQSHLNNSCGASCSVGCTRRVRIKDVGSHSER